ncbi:MAG: hypothetical protein CMH64_00505 [Nanoarchaeota archaeon]|nr:hypothetical protein [Nanoarchaeota archaeon]|tara:strand:+ start:1059 stop:1322 length:264 start_codon:yes stop_codon:yes gene_type:complete
MKDLENIVSLHRRVKRFAIGVTIVGVVASAGFAYDVVRGKDNINPKAAKVAALVFGAYGTVVGAGYGIGHYLSKRKKQELQEMRQTG